MIYFLFGHIVIATMLTILMALLLVAGVRRQDFSQLRFWMIVAFSGTLVSGVGLAFSGAQLGHLCLVMSVYSILSLAVVKFYDSRVTAVR